MLVCLVLIPYSHLESSMQARREILNFVESVNLDWAIEASIARTTESMVYPADKQYLDLRN